MKSKNVRINGRRTSIRLEEANWTVIGDICQHEGLTIHQLITLIENHRSEVSRTSAVRSFVISYLCALVPQNGSYREGIISSILSEKKSGHQVA